MCSCHLPKQMGSAQTEPFLIVMPKTILVIDDDRDIREVAKTSLELVGGFKVVLADSGKHGLDMARRVSPDSIILDLMMPDLDGQQTLAQLKLLPETASIPVIMLTAKVQANKQEFMSKGAAGVLVKPFDPMQLPDQVCGILGWSLTGKDVGHSGSAKE
jgi:two-component system, OmpR family, alkaline phosphatase synthesis response regulator PhoP